MNQVNHVEKRQREVADLRGRGRFMGFGLILALLALICPISVSGAGCGPVTSKYRAGPLGTVSRPGIRYPRVR